MRFLKVATGVMGVLILAGTATLLVMVSRRPGQAPMAPSSTVLLQEPEGTRIAGIAGAGDRLAVQLQGGGADRIVLVDARTGAVAGRVGLRIGGP